jgi:hypothetical protein
MDRKSKPKRFKKSVREKVLAPHIRLVGLGNGRRQTTRMAATKLAHRHDNLALPHFLFGEILSSGVPVHDSHVSSGASYTQVHYFRVRRHPSRVDAKRGDHFLQSRLLWKSRPQLYRSYTEFASSPQPQAIPAVTCVVQSWRTPPSDTRALSCQLPTTPSGPMRTTRPVDECNGDFATVMGASSPGLTALDCSSHDQRREDPSLCCPLSDLFLENIALKLVQEQPWYCLSRQNRMASSSSCESSPEKHERRWKPRRPQSVSRPSGTG